MFIMVNIDVNHNLVSVFDTKDGVLETVNLYPIAVQVVNKKLKVAGLHPINECTKNCIPIPNYGLAVNVVEAKKALAKDYMTRYNITQQEAFSRVGLC